MHVDLNVRAHLVRGRYSRNPPPKPSTCPKDIEASITKAWWKPISTGPDRNKSIGKSLFDKITGGSILAPREANAASISS